MDASFKILARFQTITELIRVEKRQHLDNLKDVEYLKEQFRFGGMAVDFYNIGSYTRFGAIKNSDWDLLAIMPFAIAPGVLMNQLKNKLEFKLEKNYELSIDYPALVIRNKISKSVFDFVPAEPVKPLIGNKPEYMILWNSSQFKRISPAFQFDFINGYYSYSKSEHHEVIRHGIGFLAKVFKYWKSCYDMEFIFPTFYYETVLAGYWEKIEFTTVRSLQNWFYKSLWFVTHFVVRNEPFDPYSKALKVESSMPTVFSDEVKTLLRHATKYAFCAVEAERSGNIDLAIANWNKVFNNKFPLRETYDDQIGWGQ